MTSELHRIVIVGGGAGGLELATKLGKRLGKRGRAAITLIDAVLTHLWKPLLHEVAAGSLNSHEDELNYLGHARYHHFVFRLGRVDRIDRHAREVKVAATVDEQGNEVIPRRSFGYDTLVLAVGSTTHDFGIQGVAEHCMVLDSREQADRFHQQLLRRFMSASTQPDKLREGQLNIAIAGGGATGVELAAELTEAIRVLSTYGLENLPPPEEVKLTLIEAAERLLPALPEQIGENTAAVLRGIGVDVLTGEAITAAEPGGFHTQSGRFVAAEIKVWAAGIRAPGWLAELDGLEVNKINQLEVGPTLQAAGDEAIFALGDCASCQPPGSETPVPPRAQAAHQQADMLVKSLTRRLEGKPLPHYVYQDYGSLVNLSRFDTVGNLMGNLMGRHAGSVSVEGWLARMAYLSLYKMHQRALHGIRWVTLTSLAHMLTRRSRPRLKLH